MFVSSRNISDLCQDMQFLYREFELEMKKTGIDYILTCTYRSNADQTSLYNQGRTTPGHIVTNAKAGQSKHNCSTLAGPASQAFDIAILVNGKIDWNVSNPLWKQAGAIGKYVGLEWAGDWVSFKEYPHFQLPTR